MYQSLIWLEFSALGCFASRLQQAQIAARFQIVDQLMQSLDKPDPEIDRLWGEEAVRRLASFDAGRSKTYSPEEVFDQD